MATIRLIPSAYSRSNTNYVTVTSPGNMYNNVDHTSSYCSLRGRAGRSSNSTYYAFIHGFDFSEVPSNATVTSFKVKIRAYRNQYQATGNTNYRIALASKASNSYKIGNTTLGSDITTTSGGEVYEIPTGSLTWETLKGYGTNFSIDIPLRNSSTSSSYYPYVYVYGAEIEVTYTLPTPRTISTTLSGNGTITPSGSNTYYDGDEVEVVITPTNKSDTVTATRDGTDITSQLVAHGAGATVSAVPDDVTTSDIQSGSSYAQYAIGHSAESPYSSTSNMYASQSSTGYAAYSFDFSDIPSNATIENIEVRCHGHRESSTISSTYVSQCAIYNGSTAVSDTVNFPSTSSSIITLTPNQTITRSDLDNLTVRHYVGYYGGLVTGITFEVEYSTGTGLDHYTYTFTVSADTTIAVTIGGSVSTPKAWKKVSGTYREIMVWKKTNGTWNQITEPSTVINIINKYIYEVNK